LTESKEFYKGEIELASYMMEIDINTLGK